MSSFSPNTMLRNPLKILSIVAGGSFILIGSAIALNWNYLRRAITYPEKVITQADWYQPLAKVQGNPSTLPTVKADTIPSDSIAKISDYAKAHNSASLLVLHKGKLVSESYWRGFESNSTSNSMSMSKTVVALLIGIAIEEGHIDSELDTVAKYIPEWSEDKRSQITLQDMLYMHSGLRNEDKTSDLGSDLVQMYIGKDVDRIALNIPALSSSQKDFDYNNANTQILGKVLERATGEKYVDYLSTRLWKPLQASEAGIWLDRPQGNPKTFCCLFATGQDWVKIGQLFVNQGIVNHKQIVPSAWLDKMIQPSPLESNYGYHIWLEAKTENKPGGINRISSQPFAAIDTVYLDGASFQRVYVIPSHDLVIVRIGEKPEKWDDSIIPNTLVNSLQNQKIAATKN